LWTFCWRNHSVRFFSLIRQVWWLIHTSVLTAAEFHPNLASAGIIGLILVESAMLTPQSAVEEDTEARWSRMLMLSSCRRDNWASRKDALQYFQSKRPWSRWDPGVLSLYIVRILQCDDPIDDLHEIKNHGLYEHPDGRVSLKCDKSQESSAFADKEPHFNGLAWLGKLSNAVPSHIIWGKRKDFMCGIMLFLFLRLMDCVLLQYRLDPNHTQ